MVITLSKELEKEISSAVKQYGYNSEKSFVEDALKQRILVLKKSNLKEQLRERALFRAGQDLEVAQDWFLLENESWFQEAKSI